VNLSFERGKKERKKERQERRDKDIFRERERVTER